MGEWREDSIYVPKGWTMIQGLQFSKSLQLRRSRILSRRSRWGMLYTRMHRVRAGKRRGMLQHMS